MSKVHELKPLPKFKRQFKKLPKDIQLKISNKLKILQKDYLHPSLRTKRHKSSGCFESSINMNYRIIWNFEEDTIILLIAVGTHKIL